MSMNYIQYNEIRNSFFNNNEKAIYIDCYKTDDDNEEGVVVARIFVEDGFRVVWQVDEAKENPFVIKAICEAIDKYKAEHKDTKRKYSACVNVSLNTKPMFSTKKEANMYAEFLEKQVSDNIKNANITSVGVADVQYYNTETKEWEYSDL